MKLKTGISKVGAVVFGAAAGAIGAVVTGGVTAAVQYVQANGATQNWQAVGGAAAAGAVLGAAAYFFPSPLREQSAQ
ncbi:hypothetical protein TSACC_2905 [Terrimicrobium sacchariphilum]|jgi:hypothetical protein|uniref:Uncharacterized protein n=1 Tax=Terrimicrobium sacchariphilum TaxID=690879 RepID=A0A146G747_TERSA|nr:hypothetical protein [Terrimicrobium sacchariphilum]GAT32506.1 hypothetical protein TSACC_2905 [Terrimicrobium sacchariphilum]